MSRHSAFERRVLDAGGNQQALAALRSFALLVLLDVRGALCPP